MNNIDFIGGKVESFDQFSNKYKITIKDSEIMSKFILIVNKYYNKDEFVSLYNDVKLNRTKSIIISKDILESNEVVVFIRKNKIKKFL